uniref:Putative coat protein n=1 Tax=Rosellinia necatrix partitivirus 10 TaxID=2056545 RepID=A0A2Z5WAD9_9VIRU|nr:putative coat protein [Rosellinia necatrix partitivirus 10]
MPNRSSSSRQIDRESGRDRLSSKSKRRQPPPRQIESESESEIQVTDVESELEMPAKDDSRRKKAAPPPPAIKGKKRTKFPSILKGDQGTLSDLDDEKEKETDSKVAPHMLLLLGATFHIGLSTRTQPALNHYIPSAANMFQMILNMCSLLSTNTLLHEVFPAFFSPALFLYYGHAFYYHILRARRAAAPEILDQIETRMLRFYENIGPPESWPIAAPLIGFFSYLGAHKPEDTTFSWIIPALPDFTRLGDDNALADIHSVPGIQRVPLIPALRQFLHNFGTGNRTSFDASGRLIPVPNAALGQANSFLGLTSSAANSDNFLNLTWNTTWIRPTEFDLSVGPISLPLKKLVITSWAVPTYNDTSSLNDLQKFLGFGQGQNRFWMSHLFSLASTVNRFFPGSTNLSKIDPLTTIGMTTKVTHFGSLITGPPAVADNWYNDRDVESINIHGYTNTDVGKSDTLSAVAVSPRAEYVRTAPGRGRQLTPEYGDGVERSPYFVEDPNDDLNHHAIIVTQSLSQRDPTLRFGELLSSYYDNTGRKA